MKKQIALLLILSPTQIFAAPPPKGDSVCLHGDCDNPESVLRPTLSKMPKVDSVVSSEKKRTQVKKPRVTGAIKPQSKTPASDVGSQAGESNLPGYYVGTKAASADHSSVVLEVKPKAQILSQVAIGDIFKAVIEQELEVSSTVKQPVRAFLISGPYKGSVLFGEAFLDAELHRVLISFNYLKTPAGAYQLKATALSKTGTPGLHGEYHTQSGLFFLAEVASNFTAALLDAGVQRTPTLGGGYATSPSLENSGKIAAAQSAANTAKRFSDDAKAAPRYTSVTAYQEILVIIEDVAKRKEL